MPSKDNCKATQIFDGDHDLFDFEKEVEPMLNVLVLKTLEQARMEVLEEEELKIMKEQKKEYEEIRNAELIEAQRFEAAEGRVKSETDRRGVQQKARKVQRKLAHQKFVSRVLAKNYMKGIRETAIQQLADVSMFEPKLERDLHEDVLPWLKAKMAKFMKADTQAVDLADRIIEAGINHRRKEHGATLKAREDRIV